MFIKTVKVVISRCCFAEDGTDLFIRACRTCSTIIFPHSTNQILNSVPVFDAKTPYWPKRTADRPIVYNPADVKEPTHCSKRVGHGIPGVVVWPCLYRCEVKYELKAAAWSVFTCWHPTSYHETINVKWTRLLSTHLVETLYIRWKIVSKSNLVLSVGESRLLYQSSLCLAFHSLLCSLCEFFLAEMLSSSLRSRCLRLFHSVPVSSQSFPSLPFRTRIFTWRHGSHVGVPN